MFFEVIICCPFPGHLKVGRTSTLKVAAMVLILGRRLNREDSAIRDSPAVKRKVLPNDTSIVYFIYAEESHKY